VSLVLSLSADSHAIFVWADPFSFDSCSEALLYAEKHSPVDLKKLSPDGRRLIEDLRDIIETG